MPESDLKIDSPSFWWYDISIDVEYYLPLEVARELDLGQSWIQMSGDVPHCDQPDQ